MFGMEEKVAKLKEKFGERVEEDVNFSDLTTVKIGGPARVLFRVESVEELREVVEVAKEIDIPFFVMGGGSNLLVADEGLDKLVIKIEIGGVRVEEGRVVAGAGATLQELVDFSVEQGLSGLQLMTGIPGMVGGAIYGNAGAYGQTISDRIVAVKCLDPDTLETIHLGKDECGFDYRESDFKRNGLIVVEASFALEAGDKDRLVEEKRRTLETREKKYKPGILCPGSFFKNLITSQVPKEALEMLPPREDTYGKLPAYIFIEELGLKGKRVGDIEIASFHGNLFINLGEGKAKDFWDLAKECFDKTKEKYGVELEPEVQLVSLPDLNQM